MAITEHNLGKVVGSPGDINESVATFSQASTRENINSGEKGKIIFGKIKKMFADLKTGAFSTVANNLSTTAEWYVLDARQGKILDERINNVNTVLGRKADTTAVTPSANGLMTAADKKKLDGLKTGSTATVVNNLSTTVAGYVLDARQGKILDEKINNVNAVLNTTKGKFVNVTKMYAGTKIVRGGGHNTILLFTNAEINRLLGVSNSNNTNTVLICSNGDYNATTALTSCVHNPANGWHARFDHTMASGVQIRVNFFIAYWG